MQLSIFDITPPEPAGEGKDPSRVQLPITWHPQQGDRLLGYTSTGIPVEGTYQRESASGLWVVDTGEGLRAIDPKTVRVNHADG